MVTFDQLQNILRTPADVTISNVDEDVKAGGLPYTFLGGAVNWKNCNSHFGRHFGRAMVEDIHALGPTVPPLEMCGYV